ncbi:MAG: hypothetical protein B7733_23085 [Myxococcales bacterium FL481]|nr:MAG: hypothetical protein B7733_23085 [Myxococcales bacterium FL481]
MRPKASDRLARPESTTHRVHSRPGSCGIAPADASALRDATGGVACGWRRRSGRPLVGVRSLSRLGLIGDVHGEHVALRHALAFLTSQSLDAIACVGDIADGDGDVDDCCRQLASAAVDTVRGNHDRWLLDGVHRNWPGATQHVEPETRQFLAERPPVHEYRTNRGVVVVGHGVGPDDEAQCHFDTPASEVPALTPLLARPDLRCLIGGHTHRPMVRHFGQVALINPGTLRHTRPQRVAVLDFDAARPQSEPSRGVWQRADPAPQEPAIPVTSPTMLSSHDRIDVAFYRRLDDSQFVLECRGRA